MRAFFFKDWLWLGGFTVACADEPSEPDPLPVDPRPALEACGLPVPCGPLELSDTTIDMWPFEDAVCVYDTIVSNEPAHITVMLPYATYWNFYTAGGGWAVLVTSQCEDDVCTEHAVTRCTFTSAERLACPWCVQSSCPNEPRVCGDPLGWCKDLENTEPQCP
jgi:hypothetical protein